MAKNNEETRTKTSIQIVGLIIAIITIIIALVTLYFQFFRKPSLPPIINGDNGNGQIPGVPQLWEFDESVDPPGKSIWWYVGGSQGPVHMTTVSGQLLIENTCPECWFKKKLGVQGKVVRTNGQHHPVFIKEPAGGMGEGWHSFEGTVGLSNVEWFYIVISRHYGFGDDVLRLGQMIGEALVVV